MKLKPCPICGSGSLISHLTNYPPSQPSEIICCESCVYCNVLENWNEDENRKNNMELSTIVDEQVTVKTTYKAEVEVMNNNTFLHPAEKLILRSFVSKMVEFVDPEDVDTPDNKEFKNAIEILTRISL